MDTQTLQAQGWKCVETDGFTGLAGPFWILSQQGECTTGFTVEPRHCNNHMGTLHGGMVMTFADIALGIGMSAVMGEQAKRFATLSLQTQFVAVARIGDFVTCTAEVVRQGKDIVFVRGLIKVGEKNIASVEGIWKRLAGLS